MPPHDLRLKHGAIVMLLRNLNVKDGLCNGTRLIVDHMGDRVLQCTIARGQRAGQQVLIPRIELAPTDTTLPFVLRRRQFPLRLAFSMTINKSQGQTFKKVGLLLTTPVFSHGQLYVGCSRVRSFSSLKIMTSGFPPSKKTENIVFKEIL